MNPFQHRIPGYSRDNTSSIYSRSTDTAKDAIPMTTIPTTLQIKPSLPEINLLDHQISMARGSTMALETTRPRLRKSKTNPKCRYPNLPPTCQHHNGRDPKSSSAVSFQPGKHPFWGPAPDSAIVSLRVALDKARAEETSAEQEWKQQWKVSSVRQSSLRWL
ncbi:unnamed protein product [Penicillium nalgiovense]|nr:unnamed protein product [Penicillium nalgiovense]